MDIYMPDIDLDRDQRKVFADARKLAVQEQTRHGNSVVVVTPGRILMGIPCSPPGSMQPQVIGPIQELAPLPATTITVIGFNDVVRHMPNARMPEVEKQRYIRQMMNEAVPFFGYVLGFGYLGHSVILFEGHPQAYADGIRGAEMLMVDSAMIEALPEDWIEIARREMIGRRRVVVFNRNGGLEAMEMPPPDEAPAAPSASPEQSAALVREGQALAKAENYAEAIARFSEALAQNPNYMQALKYRAAAYLESPDGQRDSDREAILGRVNKLRGMLG